MKRYLKVLRLIKYRRKKIFGTIGNNNFFADGAYIDDNAEVGNYNYFGSRCMVLFAKIGNYCSIAPNVIIAPANHSLHFITTSNNVVKNLKTFNYSLFQNKTFIGNDVWIGANVVIAQGVRIGDGVVIGANSFVNKDLPAFSVAVGSPARIIKYRFDEELMKTIQKSQWWDMELTEAVKMVDELALNHFKS